MAKKNPKRKVPAKKAPPKVTPPGSGSGKKRPLMKRDLIVTPTMKGYAHRNPDGTFHDIDEQRRSLSADRRRKAKTKSKAGYGDQGDRARPKKAGAKRKKK